MDIKCLFTRFRLAEICPHFPIQHFTTWLPWSFSQQWLQHVQLVIAQHQFLDFQQFETKTWRSKSCFRKLPLLPPFVSKGLASADRTNSSWRDVACNFLRVNPEFVRNLRHSFHDALVWVVSCVTLSYFFQVWKWIFMEQIHKQVLQKFKALKQKPPPLFSDGFSPTQNPGWRGHLRRIHWIYCGPSDRCFEWSGVLDTARSWSLTGGFDGGPKVTPEVLRAMGGHQKMEGEMVICVASCTDFPMEISGNPTSTVRGERSRPHDPLGRYGCGQHRGSDQRRIWGLWVWTCAGWWLQV